MINTVITPPIGYTIMQFLFGMFSLNVFRQALVFLPFSIKSERTDLPEKC